MKILVLSDSHKVLANLDMPLDRHKNQCEIVFFLGDGLGELNICRRAYPNYKYYFVSGNCDISCFDKETELIVLSGKKILLTHGHKFEVKTTMANIAQETAKNDVDICVYGHTHIPTHFSINNTFFLNPGSLSRPKDMKIPSYAIICIDGDNVSHHFFHLSTGQEFFVENNTSF